MTDAPNFYCYSPRPVHVDLPPLESAIWHVLNEARGFYKVRGMSPKLIMARIAESHMGMLGTLPTVREITAALWRMRGLEIVEQHAHTFDWRLKR